MNLKPAGSREGQSDVVVSCSKDTEEDLEDASVRGGSQKRKQETFLAEIHERAEVRLLVVLVFALTFFKHLCPSTS